MRNLELQESCLRRATASKRMAGASRDAATETESRWRVPEKEKNPRGGREPPRTTSRCQTGAWTDWMAQDVRRCMAKCGHRDADRLEQKGCTGALALGNCKGAQFDGDQSDDWDRTRAEKLFCYNRKQKDSTSSEQS